jgi:uncharacterized protein YdaU (DUF1376 family)
MKDPAFLFYTGDFLAGTMFFTDEQLGIYLRLLMAQHQHGHLTEKQVNIICKSCDKEVLEKFEIDTDGNYYNARLDLEINKRKAYSESRSKNRTKKEDKPKKDIINTSITYVNHMEDRNKDVNKDKEKMVIPEIEKVILYFKENGYTEEAAKKAFQYYSVNEWKDSKGNTVKNWKQKMISVWFKEENKVKEIKPTVKTKYATLEELNKPIV